MILADKMTKKNKEKKKYSKGFYNNSYINNISYLLLKIKQMELHEIYLKIHQIL